MSNNDWTYQLGPYELARREEMARQQQMQQQKLQQDVILRWIEQQMAKQAAKPPELPDEFTAWVEEVRRQNRIEELLTVLIDKCVK